MRAMQLEFSDAIIRVIYVNIVGVQHKKTLQNAALVGFVMSITTNFPIEIWNVETYISKYVIRSAQFYLTQN